MNKNEFLEELGSHLRILEDREQADILEEYAQHIDMKIENGLSEEEAIRDFGAIKELASEILEAYHVKPEYDKEKTLKWKPDTLKAKEEGVKAYHSVLRLFSKFRQGANMLGKAVLNAGKTVGKTLFSILVIPWNYSRSRPERIPKQEPAHLEKSGRLSHHAYRFFHGIGHALASCWFLFLGCAVWFCLLAWNCLILFLALWGGIFTLFALFSLGVLTVGLFSGYPIFGLTLICLGMNLCGGTATVLLLYLLRFHKKSADPNPAAEPITEEVFHA